MGIRFISFLVDYRKGEKKMDIYDRLSETCDKLDAATESMKQTLKDINISIVEYWISQYPRIDEKKLAKLILEVISKN
jgi:hypothetical protein